MNAIFVMIIINIINIINNALQFLYIDNINKHHRYLFAVKNIWFRGIYTRRVSILGFNPSCSKRSEHYADTDIKTDEDTNYQEIGPPREETSISYQNTTLQ